MSRITEIHNPSEITEIWGDIFANNSRLTNEDLHALFLDIQVIRLGDRYFNTFRTDFRAALGCTKGILRLGRYYPNNESDRLSASLNYETQEGTDDLVIEPNYEYSGKARFSIKVPVTPSLIALGGELALGERYIPVSLTRDERFTLAYDVWRSHLANPTDLTL